MTRHMNRQPPHFAPVGANRIGMEEDKAHVAADIKEVFAEAKGEGFDAKILRKVVRLRKMDKAKRREEEALLDLYLSAIGEV